MRTLAHITHEAVEKVGGIGAVLQGLLTCNTYRNREQRTILIGPTFVTEGSADGRLGASGEVLYSSVDGLTQHPVGRLLDQVRRDFHVEIIYGYRRFHDPHTGVRVAAEVVLIDVSRMSPQLVNGFKGRLWETYGIDSSRYESSWDYDMYVRLAEPAIAVLKALGAADSDDECVILAHEFMGLPTALAARLDPSGVFRTVFYAHEVAAIRKLVEEHPGHDVTFYNVLSGAMNRGRYLNQVFGSQDHYHRHALVKRSRFCDRIFSVGDYVTKELLFIGPEFADAAIDTVYNGIPAERISVAEKRVAQERMRDYAETLLGDRPDYIFTHVARMAVSKGLWRDLAVLEHLEKEFRRTGKTAVLFVLSTEVPPRRPEDVREMERWWHWPLAHREVGSDLSHGEAVYYQGVQVFNARSRMIKAIYVNQFGWEHAVCGSRMPQDMTFMDIRRASDVEFGMSIYEPFGIAQFEPLTFGAICVPSRVCGCVGFLEKITGGAGVPNVFVADYCDLGPGRWDEKKLLALDRDQRTQHERKVAERIARYIIATLPQTDAQTEEFLGRGYDLSSRMSWDVVAGQYILPAIDAICARKAGSQVA
ncbi:MAG: hypothetical protein ACUVXJ_04880 [Phycisphaerae bacterium]